MKRTYKPKKKQVAKKTKRKAAAKKRAIKREEVVGKITHYYGKIGVAIIKLLGPLKKGESVRIEGGQTQFSQKVGSMEIDHKKVTAAKKGDEIGLKVKQKAREGYRVYRIG